MQSSCRGIILSEDPSLALLRLEVRFFSRVWELGARRASKPSVMRRALLASLLYSVALAQDEEQTIAVSKAVPANVSVAEARVAAHRRAAPTPCVTLPFTAIPPPSPVPMTTVQD